MDGAIPLDRLTPDQVECELIRLEAIVARVRGVQARLVERAVVLELPKMDGARSVVDWLSARLDVTRETALDLARVARSDDVDALMDGEASFDRVVVRSRLLEVGASKELLAESNRHDISGVRRLAARHRRITRIEDRRAVLDRAVVFEENYARTMVRFWGRLPGREGRLVREMLDALGDTVPRDAAATREQRAADALVMLCQGERPDNQPAATVIVDARLAAPSDGEAGVAVLQGLGIGPRRSRRSCAEIGSRSSASPGTALPSESERPRRRSRPSSAGSFSPATEDAWSRAAHRRTVSRSTTSSPPQRVARPTPRISSPCAGTTTTQSSTAAVSRSTPTPHQDDASCSHRAARRPRNLLADVSNPKNTSPNGSTSADAS